MAELVSAARHGDRAAFGEIVRRTYGDTYTLAFRLTGNEDDARDAQLASRYRGRSGIMRHGALQGLRRARACGRGARARC